MSNEMEELRRRMEAVRKRKPSLAKALADHVDELENDPEPEPALKRRGRPLKNPKATPVADDTQKSLPDLSLASFSALDDGGPAPSTLDDLASALGISVSSLRQLDHQLIRRQDGSLPVVPNRALLQALGYIAGVEDGLTPKERMELRKLRAVCERLEFEFEVYRGRFMERSEVDRQVSEAAGLLRQELLTVKRLSVDWAGLSSAELAASFENAVERALVNFIESATPGAIPKDDPVEEDSDSDTEDPTNT